MKHILIHGLGQDDQSWNPIKTLLNEKTWRSYVLIYFR